MKRKIDIIVKYFYPVAAGIEANIMETYSVLASSGWDVTLHTTKDTLTEKNVLPDFEKLRGIKIKRYPFISDNMGFNPDIDWDKTNLVCLHNFNVFHLRFLWKCFLLKITGRKKFGLVVVPHGGFTPEWNIFPVKVRFVKWIYHFSLGSFLINNVVDAVRAVSEWEGREIVRHGVFKEKLHVIPNGLEDEGYMDLKKLASGDIKRRVKSWGKYIIFIGRIYGIKNLETTLRALTLTPKYLNFVIIGPVGDIEYKNNLERLIEKLGLKTRVYFAGVVWGVDKFYTIKNAQMMVHMALWESFCNVVHEGLAMGLPLVVANNTALPLLVKDGVNGYLVETMDYKNVAAKVNHILINKNSRELKEMSEVNRKFGLEESWTNVAGKMNKLYSKLV